MSMYVCMYNVYESLATDSSCSLDMYNRLLSDSPHSLSLGREKLKKKDDENATLSSLLLPVLLGSPSLSLYPSEEKREKKGKTETSLQSSV